MEGRNYILLYKLFCFPLNCCSKHVLLLSFIFFKKLVSGTFVREITVSANTKADPKAITCQTDYKMAQHSPKLLEDIRDLVNEGHP